MEPAEHTLATLIEKRLKELNTNAFAFERAHGLPADAIRSVLRGGKKGGTALNRAKELCEALGLELYIGPPRENGQVEQIVLDGRDFAHIPLHGASLAAGDGAQNEDEAVIDHLAFRRSWLKSIGMSASTAVVARAQGNSMAPSIHDGDMVLIDRARTEVPIRRRGAGDTRPAPIYALLDGTGARIKRLERPEPDLVMLLSDNTDYAPQLARVDSLSIIGKVMWWGHTNRE